MAARTLLRYIDTISRYCEPIVFSIMLLFFSLFFIYITTEVSTVFRVHLSTLPNFVTESSTCLAAEPGFFLYAEDQLRFYAM